MMEDTWLSVEDDSRDSSFADSDVIDSDTEAELYSLIHYEQNLHNLQCLTTESENVQTSDETKNVTCTGKKKEFVITQSVCSKRPFLKNDDESNVINKFNYETVFLNKVAQKFNLIEKEESLSNDKCNVSYSESSENIHVNQTVKDKLLNNKKRKNDYDSSKSSSLRKKNCTDLNDSSDSDSIIWTEVDASDNKEFQTNLYEDDDIICLSSESESESQFNCLPLSKKSEKNLKNLSMPNIKLGENIKDLWFINDQDLYRPKKSNSRRYHDNVENSCTNCSGKGHNSRICPMPRNLKCFICGGSGHLGSLCVNRICGRCFNTGHDSRRCWKPHFSHCTLCSMKGHVTENCPDLWRRYHLTTQPGEIVRGKVIDNSPFPYCWNCGQGGHFGAICKESRGPKHSLPTWPCVVSYDDPEDLLRNRGTVYWNKCNFKRNDHFNPRNISVVPNFRSETKKKKKTARPSLKGYDDHFNPRNVSVVGNFSSEKKKKKKKNKLNQQCKNMNIALREKDFPRTPKNNQSSISEDAVPEFVNQLLIKKQRQKERRKQRNLRRRLKFLAKKNGSGDICSKQRNANNLSLKA